MAQEINELNAINEMVEAYKKIVTNSTTKPKLGNFFKMLGIQPNKMQQELIRLWDYEYENYMGIGLFCGRGAGKSVAVSVTIALELLIPGASVILVSPSNAQLDIIWRLTVKLLKQLKIPQTDITVSVSIGACQLDSLSISLEGAMSIADEALYMAKENGRNRTEWGV